MNDTLEQLAFSSFTAVNTTVVKFKLVTRNKGDGDKYYLVMVDQDDAPFPGDDVVVESEKFIEVINDTGGYLVIFLQKNANTGVPGSPFRDGVKLVKLDPGDSRTARVRKLGNAAPAEPFTFTAVALTASGDLAFFDPRIIIKPQSIAQLK